MPAPKMKPLVPPDGSLPPREACRWVFLPPVATADDVRFVFESVLLMLTSDPGMRSRWIVDISGLCRSASNFADEVVAFVESATARGFEFEVNGVESLPISARQRIRELLAH